jgi:hypothetical protein
MADTQQRSVGQRVMHGLESKILVPAAAGIVTLGVKYLLKKLPLILEEKVLPKLAEKGVPEKVTQAVEGTATTLGGGDEDAARDEQEPAQQESTKAKPAEQAPDSDREAERRKREQRRQQRKRDVERAA